MPFGRLALEHLEERALLAGAAPLYIVEHQLAQPAYSASPVGYTAAQVRQAYGINSISVNGIAGAGAGQTIAIIDAYDDPAFVNSSSPNFASSDLHQFDVAMGLPDPPSFRKVAQDGSSNYPAQDAGWDGEIALDVEWTHALAPQANILLIEANDNSYTNLIFNAVGYARRQAGVSVVTMSFGGGEFQGEQSLDGYFTTPAGHIGMTFVASTGDNGTPGGYPALSPNVLAVGGTRLLLGSGSSYAGELAWSGSGGGISTLESQPAYQSGVVTQSTAQRTIPDVAFDADPRSGVAVYDSVNNGSAAPWWQVGGTSFSAPAWAALVSIADQLRVANGLSTLDGRSQTLPSVYTLPSADFHDVTSGNNGTYSAAVGYDLVTGRGSPIANLLVPDLAGIPKAPTATIAPPSDIVVGHTTGTTTMNVTVSNPNHATLSYTASIVSEASVIQQRLALVALMPDGSYDLGDTIANSKWFQSTNDSNSANLCQYFLLPDGTLHFWDGNANDTGASTLVASLDPSVYGDPALLLTAAVAPTAYNLEATYGFAPLLAGDNYATNDTIAGARWLRSTTGSDVAGDQMHQYYLLPDGSLHFWDGYGADTGASTLVAALAPAYYQDPQLLVHAQEPALPAGVSAGYTATGTGGATLQIAGFKNFAGSFGVQLGVSDGTRTFTTSFLVAVTDSAPTLTLTGLTPPSSLTPIPTATTPRTSASVVAQLTGADADSNEALSYASSVVSLNYAVEQQLGLTALLPGSATNPFALGDTITNAKWLQSTSGNDVAGDQLHQYYLLPDGSLHFWDGNASHTGASTLVASLGAGIYADPTPLLTATTAQLAYSTQQALALTSLLPGNNYATGDTIAGAKWLQSSNGSNAANAGQYYLLPDGSLHAWDGNTEALPDGTRFTQFTSPVVARLAPSYYQDPRLLLKAQQPAALPAGLTANVSQNGNNITVTFSGPANLAGTFGVSVSVSDAIFTTTKDFLVTVTDSPPALAPINDQTVAHNQPGSPQLSVMVSATDPDAADRPNLTYSAKVFTDPLGAQAFQVQQQLALTALMPDGSYDLGDTIAGAKWLQGTTGNDVAGDQLHQYYLLPNGELHFWDGNANDTGASTLVATFNAAYYSNPLLLNPQQAGVTVSTVGTGASATLNFNGFGPYAGTVLSVYATASDGVLTSAQLFRINVT
jgi:hypothetical protein